MKRFTLRAFVAALLFVIQFAVADEPRPFSHPDRIRYDAQCLTIDGKDTFIYSGAFHYFRCPKELWRDRFQKIKEAGFNAVETYAPWNWHEREMPKSLDDFSKVDLRDLDDWLTMAEEFGFYTIVRPGPYICAEWDGGGFPRWLALKKPALPLRKEMWLRTDDPVFLAWSKHWYDAVCPVVAKHQITRKKPGERGVILFQIENEYNYAKLPAEMMVNHLKVLAEAAVAGGIDVPLFTCWTQVIRSQKEGILRSVFDCTNFYPRWNVEKEERGALSKLRSQQPDAPLATTEMQGGWFSKVGGKLSEQQDGVTAAQIQNVTLLAWQMGETITNYYMLFGGTNFDDWGGRDMTTTYDYNAPIREHGGVDARYQRVWALGQMLHEHGAKLTRAEKVEVEAITTDKDVEITELRAQDGSRYIFVRTENHDSPREGTAHVQEKSKPIDSGADVRIEPTPVDTFVFDYKLESFGSLVLYLPPGAHDANQGEWLPKPAPEIKRPTDLPSPVAITEATRSKDPRPIKWARLQPGEHVENRGALNRHFLYYRITAKPGATLSLGLRSGDGLIASAGGKLLPVSIDKKAQTASLTMPSGEKQVVLLYENAGQSNGGKGMEDWNGLQSVKGADENEPVEFSSGESYGMDDRERGESFSRLDGQLDRDLNYQEGTVPNKMHDLWTDVTLENDSAPDALLTWYRMKFKLPEKKSGVWVPWHLHLEAKGNGFIYINGHALGRYWQAGPQHDFYLPESWLEFGNGKKNIIALDLRPVDKDVSLQAASIAPDNAFAESR